MYRKRAKETVLWVLKNSLDRVQFFVHLNQYVIRIKSIQGIFSKHMSLQRGRRTVLTHFWKIEIQNEMVNNEKKGSQKWDDQNAYIAKV